MLTVEESVIQDKIETAHRSRENEYKKKRQSLQNLQTGSSQSQTKPSEQSRKYMFRKVIHKLSPKGAMKRCKSGKIWRGMKQTYRLM